jgi:DNA gyrase subunit B
MTPSTPSNADSSDEASDVAGDRERIRRRPAMHIGSCDVRGLHYLIYELISNSLDEIAAGACRHIDVELLACGGCRVSDDGRGIPVEPVLDGKRFFEVALAHPSRRLPNCRKTPTMPFSGFHHVGLFVVNALSTDISVEIRRDGRLWRQCFQHGKSCGPAPSAPLASGRTGTRIVFWPDPAIFRERPQFDFEVLADRLRQLAALNKGVTTRLSDYRDGRRRSETFHFPEGIVSFVRQLNQDRTPVHATVIYFREAGDDCAFEAAFQWTTSASSSLLSFVNSGQTNLGGTHVEGFHRGLSRALTEYARLAKVLPEDGPGFQVDDWRPGLTAVVAATVREPNYAQATKERLNNPEVQSFLHRGVHRLFTAYLQEHAAVGRAILSRVMESRTARTES